MNAVLTPPAEKFIRRMLRMSGMPVAGFRLRVRPGGCSGFAAEFEVEAAPVEDDIVWQSPAGQVFVDLSSAEYLNGATVDFVDSLSQTGFVITTSQSTGACCSSATPPQLVSIGRSSSPR